MKLLQIMGKIQLALLLTVSFFITSCNLSRSMQLGSKTIQEFEYIPVDTIEIPKVNPIESKPTLVITADKIGYYSEYENIIAVLYPKTNEFHKYSISYNFPLFTQFSFSPFKIDHFSFVNDSVVVISIPAKFQLFHDYGLYFFDLFHDSVLYCLNFNGTNLLNSTEFPIDTIVHNRGFLNTMDIIFNYGIVDFYNKLDTSLLIQKIGTIYPMDNISALEKENFIKLYTTTSSRRFQKIDIYWNKYLNNFNNIPLSGEVGNYFHFIPMYTRINDSILLVTYKFGHPIIKLNIYSLEQTISWNQPSFIPNKLLVFPDSNSLNTKNHFRYSHRTFFNNNLNLFHRIGYFSDADSVTFSNHYQKGIIDIVYDKNLTAIGLVVNNGQNNIFISNCVEGRYFGYDHNTVDDKFYRLIEYKIQPLGAKNSEGYFNYKSNVN